MDAAERIYRVGRQVISPSAKLVVLAWAACLAAVASPAPAEAEAPVVLFAARQGDARDDALWLAVEAHFAGLPLSLERAEIGAATADIARAARSRRAARGARAVIWLEDGGGAVWFEDAKGSAARIPIPAAGESWTARCAMAGTLLVQRVSKLGAEPSASAPHPKAAEPKEPETVPIVAPSPAPAPPPTPLVPVPTREEARPGPRISLAPRVGVAVPISALSPFVHAGIDLDLAFPMAGGRLSVALDVSYTRPGREGRATDPELGDVAYDFTIHEVRWALDLVFRFYDRGGRFAAFLGAGPVAALLVARETTSAGGRVSARGAAFGGEAALATLLRLGAGGLILDVRYALAKNDLALLGGEIEGEVTTAIGYRFEF